MHIVGVPVKYKNKNGMVRQVGKSDVFTKESLRKLQDKMRILCIESFNKEYKLNHTLKQKMKGRGIDYHVSEMDNYQEMKKQLEKNQEKLTIANEKALELDNISNSTKELVNNLKTTITSKDKYVLNASDKDKKEIYKILKYLILKLSILEQKYSDILKVLYSEIDNYDELKNIRTYESFYRKSQFEQQEQMMNVTNAMSKNIKTLKYNCDEIVDTGFFGL